MSLCRICWIAVLMISLSSQALGGEGTALVKQLGSKDGYEWESVPKYKKSLFSGDFASSSFTEDEAVTFLRNLLLSGSTVPSALVLYVHGRGNEPAKSMQDANLTARITPGTKEPVVSKLRANGAAVAMFHWYPSKAGFPPTRYPSGPAANAAGQLATLLKAWARVKRQLPAKYSGMPCVLLCHSMGNITLQAVIQAGSFPRSKVIDTLLCSSSDVAAIGHEKWLGRGHEFCSQIIVTNKPGDGILKHARGKNNKEMRLGDVGGDGDKLAIHPTHPFAQLPLAKGVIYADFHQIEFNGWEHRYIFSQSPHSVKAFFAAALKGQDVLRHLQKDRVQVSQVQGATRLFFKP